MNLALGSGRMGRATLIAFVLLAGATPWSVVAVGDRTGGFPWTRQFGSFAGDSAVDAAATGKAEPEVVLPRLEKVADLPGGDIMDIEFALGNPNVVYLASNTNAMGIWRSDDAGETWRNVYRTDGNGPSGPAHINDIAVQPDNPDVVLVAAHGPLTKMVMVDGALLPQNFQPPEIETFAVGFSASVATLAYAADSNGNVLKSADGGNTVETVGRLESGRVFSLVVDPQSEAKLYAGTQTGVFKSTDAGQNWKQVLAGGTFDLAIAHGVSDLLFAAGGNGIFKSSDGGTTWRRTFNRQAYSVEVALSDFRVTYAGTPEGVFQSSDGGEVWVSRHTGMDYFNVGPLAVHPEDPNTVVAGSNINLWTWYGGPFPSSTQGEGIYRTTDGGLSWVRKAEREFVDADVVEVAVDPGNPNIVYAGTACSRGAYRSEDGGASWTVIESSQVESGYFLAHYTMRLVAEGSVLWLTSQFGMGWSTDGGRTWHLALKDRHFHGIAISPHDPNVIFVGTVGLWGNYPGARIFRTTDGGRSWYEVGAGFPSGSDTGIDDIAFDPFDPKVVFVTTASHHRREELSVTVGIYKSTDGGDSWMPVNTGLANLDVHSIVLSPSKAGLVFAGTHGGVFRSFDGGATWAALNLPEMIFRLLIDPADPRSIYAGTATGLFWSPDEGDSWQRLESVPAERVTGLAVDATGQVLYAAVYRVGVFKGVLRDLPPVVRVPGPIAAEATGPSGATVDYVVTAEDGLDGPLTPVCSPASGSVFLRGTTTVACTAADSSGNTASASFTVTVQDTTRPSLTVPADLTAEATGPTGAVVTYQVTATDLVDPSPFVSCSPPSGATFGVGNTTVTCTATDSAGNTATSSFRVTVRERVDLWPFAVAAVIVATGVVVAGLVAFIRRKRKGRGPSGGAGGTP